MIRIQGKIFNTALPAIIVSLLLLLLLPNAAYALTQESERRMSIGLNLFPNIISVDMQLKNKLDKNKMIKILFVVQAKNEGGQVLLKRFIKKVKTIRKITVQSNTISLSNFLAAHTHQQLSQKKDPYFASALFVAEPLSKEKLDALINIAIKLHVIVFSPFKGDVARGVTSGLFIGSKIRPFLNMKTIKNSQLIFHPLFLKLAHQYEE